MGSSVGTARISNAGLLRKTQVREGLPFPRGAVWDAKGVNFALLSDPAARTIACVIDVNPAKQGKYLAGSGLPVVAPAAAAARKPASIYVMNPNYLEEIRAQAAQAGLAAELIPIN